MIGVEGDVSNIEHAKHTVDLAIKTFNKIDVLVNNAGIADSIVPTLEQDIEYWQKIIDVHLRGTFLFSKLVGSHMIKERYGKIVNISSIAGLTGLPQRNAYGAAKAGIIAFTRSLASEWAQYQINVNAVAPGYIMTPLVQDILSNTRIVHDKLKRRIPSGKLGNHWILRMLYYFYHQIRLHI